MDEENDLDENNTQEVINAFLFDLDARRTDVISREATTFKITSAYLAAVFVIFGYSFEKHISFVFLLMPIFIASGLSLILHQERIIYLIGEYDRHIEKEVNLLLDKNCLNWETVMGKVGKNNKIVFIDGFLHLIITLPFIVLYIASVYYGIIYNEVAYDNYILFILFYSVLANIVGYFYYYFGSRKFSNSVKQLLDDLLN